MNLRPAQREELDINITPLIDVVFLLLIFFMISTSFVKESEVELTLPQAAEELRDEPLDRIEIAVDKHGRYFINGTALPDDRLATLRQALDAASKAFDGEPTLIISADEAATHQSVIDVMDVARQLGLYRVTFPTRIRDEAGGAD